MEQFKVNDLAVSGSNMRTGMAEDGKTLIIAIDTTVSIGPSSTGKLRGIASSGGFITLMNGMKCNLYLGVKP